MKRLFASIIAGIALLVAVPAFSVGAVNLNDFTISNYDITYELSKDENNRSVLKATETITADFYRVNQNHGIERAIPTTYDGHPTHLSVESVTKADGQPWEYTTNSDNGMTILRIGDPDRYVEGEQVYKIVYTQTDVTRFYADTNRDEWYWDTNGTEWKVPINQLSVSVVMSEQVAGARTGEPFCYQGASGSTDQCTLLQISDKEYRAVASNLSRGENVSIALGFTPGTFAKYEPTFWEVLFNIWSFVVPITWVLGFIVIFYLFIMNYRRTYRKKELHTIVTQYIPPKNTSVTVASKVAPTGGSVFAAQLIDFAVRHKIAIIETRPKSTWLAAEYDIEIREDPSQLLEEEREILVDMFGAMPHVGERLALKSLRNNNGYALRTIDNDSKLSKLVEGQYALRARSKEGAKFFYRWALVLLILGVVFVSIMFLMAALISWVLGLAFRPLTDNGLEIRRYLLGLDKYIKAAEEERIKMLQGPDTAEKVGYSVDPNNPGQLVKLYERVLPYAILFGHQKEWSKRLGEFYTTTQTNPGWYSSTAPFNAAVFGATISSFSTSVSYSSGSSSSSGGSSGGGSSGGGGGGGGGGGW
jgi:uncharacterized membrane protein YgcG